MNIGTKIYDITCGFGYISDIGNNSCYITWEDGTPKEFFTESFLKHLLELKMFILFETEQERLALQLKYGQ